MLGLGTAVNVATILAGTGLGLILGARLKNSISEIAMQAVGGVTLVLGIQMALEAQSGAQVIVVLLSLVAGSVLGEAMGIEARMDQLGRRLEQRFVRKRDGEADSDPLFVRGFVAASLLFCVGPMAVLGALQDGLQGEISILLTKSSLDGIASIALAAALGVGTMLSAFSVLLYQGLMTLLAGAARQIMTDPVVSAITATGGIMIIAIAVNMWGIARLRVGNMLPALAFSGIAAAIAANWGLL